jgi:hypothetical protein
MVIEVYEVAESSGSGGGSLGCACSTGTLGTSFTGLSSTFSAPATGWSE